MNPFPRSLHCLFPPIFNCEWDDVLIMQRSKSNCLQKVKDLVHLVVVLTSKRNYLDTIGIYFFVLVFVRAIRESICILGKVFPDNNV